VPQLDPEFFVSQLFWLVVTFSFLFLFLWRVSLPRIGSVLEKRENKINNDIKMAKQLQIEAEKIQDQIEQKLHDSKEQNFSLIKNSALNLQNKASEELSKLDNDLNKKIEESAKVIENNKKESLKQIHEQIHEITKLTLSKLSSVQINDQEIKESVANTQSGVKY
jgi:F-type H+-transporting ATPase subunit b|tara:strand:- start:366 stop:860 length:495 start_codon:yes stop_codon:yes gene_type:complete